MDLLRVFHKSQTTCRFHRVLAGGAAGKMIVSRFLVVIISQSFYYLKQPKKKYKLQLLKYAKTSVKSR